MSGRPHDSASASVCRFFEPVDCRDVKPTDATACERTYSQVRAAMSIGLQCLCTAFSHVCRSISHSKLAYGTCGSASRLGCQFQNPARVLESKPT